MDLIGKRFHRLTIVKTYKKDGRTHAKCQCDCGNVKEILLRSIAKGLTKSCGCLQSEKALENTKHFEEWRKHNHVEGTSLAAISRDKPVPKNTSGVTGVTWDKSRDKWMATIGLKGKRIFLGRFDKKEDAIKAREKAEKKYFKPIIDKYR